MNIRREQGITIVTLVVTIIVLLMLAGISIGGTLISINQTEESSQIAELKMVQHAILERYTAVQLTKDTLPGNEVSIEVVQEVIDEINELSKKNITLKGNTYYELSQSDLANLGIIQESDTYIVNYKTGEVINKTQKVTKTKKPIYIYSKESEE